jgi:Protein of unknown function (DUF2934)
MSSKNAAKGQILVQEVESKRGPGVSPVQRPSREEIRGRAFEIHIERGGIDGCDLDDWLQAERELEDPAYHNRNTIGEKPKT